MQDQALPCQHEGCTTGVAWRGSGRRPRYCHEHQGGKYAKARQRSRDAAGTPERPSCCEDASRRGGRLACDQHKQDPGFRNVGPGSPREDYAGALPKLPDSTDARIVAEIKAVTHGLRVGKPDDPRILWRCAMTERYGYGALAGVIIPVIGQPDLTADWQSIAGKPLPEGLVSRGADWPWAEVAEDVKEAA